MNEGTKEVWLPVAEHPMAHYVLDETVVLVAVLVLLVVLLARTAY